MNKKTKQSISNLVTCISSFFRNIEQTIVSLMRIGLLSSIKVARKSKSYTGLIVNKSCCVLGTGPSLKDDFEKGLVKTENVDIMCVNMFCSSPLFIQLRPRFYFIIDGAYFAPKTERHKQMVRTIINVFNEVDWEMYLMVSTSVVSGGDLLKGINNNYIKIIRMNSAEFSGFVDLRHWIYRHRLGMPRCQTVINFALCAAINMGYENIFLYGADHTWTRDLFVDEENMVCYGDRHVYNKELTVVKKEGSFAQLLDAFSSMFKSHYMIEMYAVETGTKIWNCSSDSFLDAYERIKY